VRASALPRLKHGFESLEPPPLWTRVSALSDPLRSEAVATGRCHCGGARAAAGRPSATQWQSLGGTKTGVNRRMPFVFGGSSGSSWSTEEEGSRERVDLPESKVKVLHLHDAVGWYRRQRIRNGYQLPPEGGPYPRGSDGGFRQKRRSRMNPVHGLDCRIARVRRGWERMGSRREARPCCPRDVQAIPSKLLLDPSRPPG
jgi:hypothetical protein